MAPIDNKTSLSSEEKRSLAESARLCEMIVEANPSDTGALETLIAERFARHGMAAQIERFERAIESMDAALRAKDRLEKDYMDYRLSVEAYDRLLQSLPETSKRLALHVGTGSLGDVTAVTDARRRALENLKRAAGEVERARQLAAVR